MTSLTRYIIDAEGRYIGAYVGTVVHHAATYAPGEPVTIASDDPSQPDITMPGDPVLVADAWDETVWPDLPVGATEIAEPPADARQIWSGQSWTWPPEILLARLADLRWRRETAGIAVDGMTVATDRDAQAMITGAALAAQIEGDGYELRWKTSGGFVTLTGAQVIALARTVRAHVQACFDAEAAMIDRIQAGEITTMEGLEAAWAAA